MIPEKIKELVETFEQHKQEYKSSSYNETQLRIQFLDPFFTALGWDVNNTQGYAEAYKDVVHEDAIKIGSTTKAPDYCFRIGGVRKFFVEAKKPSVNIKDNPVVAFQLRRYAWSAKMPISIVTDFEGFAIYDTRNRPFPTDLASKNRIDYIVYTDYLNQWDKIASVFSKEAVLKGSFDKYAESTKGKHGTSEVDDEFLKEIENWRNILAKDIAKNNPQLTMRELNDSVQKIIDRIIFLRICEDRGIEDYGRLLDIQKFPLVYKKLCEIFEQADAKYNSGLFHFHTEKDISGSPDVLTPTLNIDDNTLKAIINELYYPKSPYEFSVLPADTLGQVYEQFLGKVIRLTEGHRAVIEEKPEVKKAGGIYYTPTYIVEYIVKNTVGKLLEGKTPNQVNKLTIVDPACGSGSFLLGAYQYILNWHRDYYSNHLIDKYYKGKNPIIYQASSGDWRLTTSEKRRILLNNIYGVDIDAQAVEVTKLSLLLKVLEGENQQTLQQQLSIFHERALPDLGNNIKCGNSLISSDFYNEQQLAFISNEEQYRINAFDWKNEFSEIMMTGGFDVVIGNPPYIRIQAMKEWAPVEVEFYKKKYMTANTGNYDIYVVFVEKGIKLLNQNGMLGFILPSKFFATDYGKNLRQLITADKLLQRVVDFGHQQIFQNATTYTNLMFLSKNQHEKFEYARINEIANFITGDINFSVKSNKDISALPWVFSSDADKKIIQKLMTNSCALADLPSRIGRGSSSGADNIFILEKNRESLITHDGEIVELESELLRIPIFSTNFGRYNFQADSQHVIIFPYTVTSNGYALIPEIEMEERFPKAYQYLFKRKKELEKRKQYKTWYSFSAPRNLDVHDSAQMLVPLLANRGLYSKYPIENKKYCLMASGGFSITTSQSSNFSPEYILGLLNSRLLFWRLNSISNIFRGGWITCTKQYVETLPIKLLDLTNTSEKILHDRIVQLTNTMLILNKQYLSTQTEQEKTFLKRQIYSTDEQIDKLVYGLYGLTEDEIKIVDTKTK